MSDRYSYFYDPNYNRYVVEDEKTGDYLTSHNTQDEALDEVYRLNEREDEEEMMREDDELNWWWQG